MRAEERFWSKVQRGGDDREDRDDLIKLALKKHTQLHDLLEAAKSVLAVEFISKLHGHPYSTLRQVIQNIEGSKDA